MMQLSHRQRANEQIHIVRRNFFAAGCAVVMGWRYECDLGRVLTLRRYIAKAFASRLMTSCNSVPL
jgi:hypothetical protein